MNKLKWCQNCLSMSTRPRINFDKRGFCNACRWMEKKKKLDWSKRIEILNKILDQNRKSDGNYDCIVPVSGGKDGSYVAYNLKNKFDMNPLCITVTPPLPLELGEKNLKSFINSGYSHISINPPFHSMQLLNKIGFIEMGFPYYGWLTAIKSAVINMAIKMGISLIFYAEDGEVEYGGSQETIDNPFYDVDYIKKIYLEQGYQKVINKSKLDKNDLFFFNFPDIKTVINKRLKITHWSYFENWDPYRNYLIAKEHCGLKESEDSNSGTFTNFSQNDQSLYPLHTYLMYLKFGFGRANQDASIEIRRGAMDRSQAINLVNLYDGLYPTDFIEIYLDYYKMTKKEFNAVLDKWANKNLFEKIDNMWSPKFKIV